MITSYDKNRRLEWTHDAEVAWDQIRQDIRDCQQLFFLDPQAPVYLHTDASDYAIGAYLFQVVDGVDRPIAFMSHALSEAESRWNTTEKECYAFVYAFKKFEHLIRDIHFTLRTDHRNLTYINDSMSPKVRRWKLLVQEYDFDIEYIPGPDNIIGDALSRLVKKANPATEKMEGAADTLCGMCETHTTATATHRYATASHKYKTYRDIDDSHTGSAAVSQALAYLVHIDPSEEHVCALFEFEIPTDKYRLISKVHNSHRGHFGVEKTIEKIKADMKAKHPEEYPGDTVPKGWQYMREHVKRFIRHCPCCQKMSQIKTPIHTLGFTTAALDPMQRLNVDAYGPLPIDEEGNQYIIAIIDAFTRWVELYAVPDATAKSALRALMLHNKTFGQPHQIVSDNGTQFVNEIIEEWIELVGAEHIRTVPYSHQENTLVERSHKETQRHLRALVFDDKTHSRWSKHLGTVQRIMNASIHESIGVSPSQLLFGEAIQLDREVYLPITELNITGRQLSDWADKQLCVQRRLMESARKSQKLHDLLHDIEQANLLRDRNTTVTIFPKGTYVKVQWPRTGMGSRAPNKLRMPWRGPYMIEGRRRGEYLCRDLATDNVYTFSEHMLQVYNVDPRFDNPYEVALKEHQMFEIEEVLDIKGHPNNRSSVEVLIKWVGQERPSWHSWDKTYNKSEAIHDFLRQKGGIWRKLLPRKQPNKEISRKRKRNSLNT